MTVADLELEQELSRPYAYVARLLDAGFDVMDLSDPASPRVIYEWRIDSSSRAGRTATWGRSCST
jgi:hypothetical protein